MARSRNLSVQQFQQLMERIPKAIAGDLGKGVDEQAHRLAEVMRSVAPVGPTGNLRRSIRVSPGKHPLQKRVTAGGELTTVEVRSGSGVPYDYAMGVEFGNEQVSAQPFFWPPYRLLRSRIRSGIARKVKPAMAKVVKVE